MAKWEKFWQKLSSGQSDNNIGYNELIAYLERLGWQTASQSTSHRNYTHNRVPVAINVQRRSDGKAKAYQVRQVRAALALYTGDDIDGWLRGESIL